MDDFTQVCIDLTSLARNGVWRKDASTGEVFHDLVFSADDLVTSVTDEKVIGQAFRALRSRGVIVKVKPIQSQAEGRNGSLIWSWKRNGVV